jgi:hypothetical protein
MRLDVLLDNPQVRLQLNADVPALEWIFKKDHFLTSEELRRYLDIYLEYYRQYRPQFDTLGGLYDTRFFMSMSPEDAAYAASVNTPLLIEAGLRREAFIIPEDVFGQLSLEDYSAQAQLQTANFTTLEDARAWLAAEAQSV